MTHGRTPKCSVRTQYYCTISSQEMQWSQKTGDWIEQASEEMTLFRYSPLPIECMEDCLLIADTKSWRQVIQLLIQQKCGMAINITSVPTTLSVFQQLPKHCLGISKHHFTIAASEVLKKHLEYKQFQPRVYTSRGDASRLLSAFLWQKYRAGILEHT